MSLAKLSVSVLDAEWTCSTSLPASLCCSLQDGDPPRWVAAPLQVGKTFEQPGQLCLPSMASPPPASLRAVWAELEAAVIIRFKRLQTDLKRTRDLKISKFRSPPRLAIFKAKVAPRDEQISCPRDEQIDEEVRAECTKSNMGPSKSIAHATTLPAPSRE